MEETKETKKKTTKVKTYEDLYNELFNMFTEIFDNIKSKVEEKKEPKQEIKEGEGLPNIKTRIENSLQATKGKIDSLSEYIQKSIAIKKALEEQYNTVYNKLIERDGSLLKKGDKVYYNGIYLQVEEDVIDEVKWDNVEKDYYYITDKGTIFYEKELGSEIFLTEADYNFNISKFIF